MVARPGECSPGCPEQACPVHLEAQGLVRSQSFGEAHPPAVLPPGLLSRLPHQPFLVSSVTQFMRLTQGFAVLVELQGAGSELAPHCPLPHTTWQASPGPSQDPLASAGWVLNQMVQTCPFCTKPHQSQARTKDEATGWQEGKKGPDYSCWPRWH